MSTKDEERSSQGSHQDSKRRLLTEAIESHWEDILRGIRVYVAKLGLAEDREAIEEISREILQDTVIAALDSAPNYDPTRAARPWLLGIAINKIRRLRRDERIEQRHVTPVADLPQVHRVAHMQSGFQRLSEDEMFDLLYQRSAQRPADRSLPTLDDLLSLVGDHDQEVLRLAFVYQLRGKSLAAQLGISEGAAWSRLSRAIARLREAYEESELGVEED